MYDITDIHIVSGVGSPEMSSAMQYRPVSASAAIQRPRPRRLGSSRQPTTKSAKSTKPPCSSTHHPHPPSLADPDETDCLATIAVYNALPNNTDNEHGHVSKGVEKHLCPTMLFDEILDQMLNDFEGTCGIHVSSEGK